MIKQLDYKASEGKLVVRGYQEIPSEVFDDYRTLEILDLSDCEIREVPDTIAKLENLRVLFMSNNELDEVPRALRLCKRLEMVGLKSCKIRRWASDALPRSVQAVTLTDNQLTEIPDDIGRNLVNLKKLMLTGNALTQLPMSLADCPIEILRLSNNMFETMPEVVALMDSLAWYVDSGNRYSLGIVNKFNQTVRLRELELGDVIGSSSKNVVYACTFNNQKVAVKIFGTGITTDGLPQSEIAIADKIGADSRFLVGSIAVVINEQGEAVGMVMPRVDESRTQLASPPDMKTYTRDIYGAKAYDAKQVLNMIYGIASATGELHKKHISHGDIYAHNIVIDETGVPTLLDLGAATEYPAKEKEIRISIEARALKILIYELIERIDRSARDDSDCVRVESILHLKTSGKAYLDDVLTICRLSS